MLNKFIIIFYSLIAIISLSTQETLILNLEQSSSLAVENSFELKKLNYSIGSEMQRYSLGKRNYFPKLSLNYSDTRNVQYYSQDSGNINMSLSAEQPVFNGGRTIMGRNIQKTNILLQKQNSLIQQDEIVDACYQQFYTYLMQEKKLSLLNKMKLIGDAQTAISELELEIGTITEIDFLETIIQIKELEQNIQEHNAQLEQIDYGFKKTIGIPLEQNIKLDGEIDSTYIGLELNAEPDIYISTAISKNLAFAQTRFLIEQNKMKVELSEKTWVPNVSLLGTASLSGTNFPLQDPGYSVKLKIAFPYEWLPLSATIGISSTIDKQYSRTNSGDASAVGDLGFIVDKKLTKLGLLDSTNTQNQQLRDADFNIRVLLSSHKRNKESLKLLREKISIQKRKVDVLKTKLEIGEAKRIDYVKAQNTILDYNLQLLESVLSIILTERSFEKMLGLEIGGLKELESIE